MFVLSLLFLECELETLCASSASGTNQCCLREIQRLESCREERSALYPTMVFESELVNSIGNEGELKKEVTQSLVDCDTSRGHCATYKFFFNLQKVTFCCRE